MHELGLCESILAAVEQRAAGRPVQAATVHIGALHRVVPDALEHAWELVSGGGVAEASRLQLVEIPVRCRCRDCATEVRPPEGELALCCPHCGGAAMQPCAGDELVLESITVSSPVGEDHPRTQEGV